MTKSASFERPSFIRRIPVLRILFPFISGIIFGLLFEFPVKKLLIVLLFSFIMFMILGLLNGKLKWKHRFIQGLFISLLFFFLGLCLLNLRKENSYLNHYKNQKGLAYLICIDDAMVEHSKSFKTTGKVYACNIDGKWMRSEGKLLLYFEKDAVVSKVKYGDKLFVFSSLNSIPSPKNKGEFDYKKYLSYKQIYSSMYVKKGAFKKLVNVEPNYLIARSLEMRASIINVLRKRIKNEQECAVAVALLVGDDDAIDPELMQAYSSSGTLHVLSVSGMHVGVIYLLLAMVFGVLERNKYLKHVYYPLIILLIWGYAMLTGFSSSVLRSAMMLSLVIIGKWIHTKSPVLNTLAVSFFVLLCLNPFMITEVGFQLSYLAVFGIVYLHPMLFQKLEMPNTILHKAWELTSVSICAQLVTAPISLFYFHQFPNLFMLSNIIVIPLTTIAIYLSVLVAVCASIPFLGEWIAFADAEIIAFVNRSVLWMERIPGAVTYGISISIVECLLMYVFITFGISYLIQKRFIHLAIVISIAICISVLQLHELIEQRNQETLIEYTIPKHIALGYIKGRQHILISDSLFVKDELMQKRCLQNYWFEKGVLLKHKFIIPPE